jgi:hypothetical protein
MCQQPATYDGWQPTMHEAMAQYQTFYRLKPIGPHRPMAADLFAPARAKCRTCKGHGIRDTTGGRSWQICKACRGLGSVFTKPSHEIETLRDRVLAAYPDAAANPVPNIFAGPVIFNLETQEVMDPPRERESSRSPLCEPVFQCTPSGGGATQDVMALIPVTPDIRHLEGVLTLTADSSPLEQLLLWQPTDKGDQYLRCFLLDFGHRVLAAERRRCNDT